MRAQVPVIINDRIDVALAAGADGVHVGQEDLPAGAVRRLIGPGKILGVSCKTVEQALQAEADGADYLGVGAGVRSLSWRTVNPPGGSVCDCKKVYSSLPALITAGGPCRWTCWLDHVAVVQSIDPDS